MRRGPIFEIAIDVASPAEGLEQWLADYVSGCATDAGVADARLLRGDALLVLQIVFDSDEALDEFLSGRAARLETDVDAFGVDENLRQARVLREDRAQNLPGDNSCLNCGTPLRGQYCGQCGQRSRGRLISLWELITDAFGDLFELDSRLWQTLIPLLIRPGRLTADYLQGKRARFMPPFRTYLVLSLLFFVVAFFDPSEKLAILFPDDATPAEVAGPDTTEGAPDEAATTAEDDEGAESAAGDAPAPAEPPGVRVSFNGEDVDEDCDIDEEDMADLPGWLQRRLSQRRLKHICEQTRLDKGRSLLANVADNVPAALIVLLPLMALALKILYPLSRRYYVEHLLFFVHFHAFFFLVLTLQILWKKLIDTLGLDQAIAIIPIIVLSLYIPVYLFRAMRRVYGQGFLLTLLKYLVLLVVYVAGFTATMLGALLIAAFSI